jgi:hypothetical protein
MISDGNQADHGDLAVCTLLIFYEIAASFFELLIIYFAYFTVHDDCLDIECLFADFDFYIRPLPQIEIPAWVSIHPTGDVDIK